MAKIGSIDLTQLLGFTIVADELPDGLDFQNQTVGARLGARVGFEPTGKPKQVEFGKLLGFAAVGNEIGESVDFRADVIEAKLGAKVGVEAWVTCEDIAMQESGEV
jgi:hypothetical protein